MEAATAQQPALPARGLQFSLALMFPSHWALPPENGVALTGISGSTICLALFSPLDLYKTLPVVASLLFRRQLAMLKRIAGLVPAVGQIFAAYPAGFQRFAFLDASSLQGTFHHTPDHLSATSARL